MIVFADGGVKSDVGRVEFCADETSPSLPAGRQRCEGGRPRSAASRRLVSTLADVGEALVLRCAEGLGKIKWACRQGAVTFPCPQAHSILKRIGGDVYMVPPLDPLSSGLQGSSCTK